MKGPGEIHLDGTKAVRVAAGIGLTVLGLSLLPGLLRPPEPEPLPPDVGFRPTENLQPVPFPTRPKLRSNGLRKSRPESVKAPGRRGADRPGRGSGSRDGRDRKDGRSTGHPRSAKAEAEDPTPVATPAPQPPTPWIPPPAPAPSAPPVADDGSAEFAPR